MKEKNPYGHLIDVKKAFNRITTPFNDKNTQQTRIEGNFLNIKRKFHS